MTKTTQPKIIKQEAHHLSDLITQNTASDGPYFEFFDNKTMSAGLYELPAGTTDPQQPHETDELYYVTRGKATLIAGDEEFDAIPGSVLFVKARVEHRFVNIEEDLQVLVFFSKAEPE